jgi:P-type E1-E2 ATPase
MTIRIKIPGMAGFELRYLLLDVNGTLSDRGELLDGISERLDRLSQLLELRLVSGDTFGTLDEIAARLALPSTRAADGQAKLRIVEELGARHCVVVGNGSNDAAALRAAALGIAVLGREGASALAIQSADAVCTSIFDAFDLLTDERALFATLRR